MRVGVNVRVGAGSNTVPLVALLLATMLARNREASARQPLAGFVDYPNRTSAGHRSLLVADLSGWLAIGTVENELLLLLQIASAAAAAEGSLQRAVLCP